MEGYRDPRIECGADGIVITGYYPWGSKRIAYSSVRALQRVALSAARGRGRIWGTANPRYWANFDPQRPKKHTGFVIDLGRNVSPFVTPDDPDGFESVVRAHAGLGEATGEETTGPVI